MMASKAGRKKEGGLRDTLGTVFWALVIAAIFRSLLFQPFSIPSGSMKPTLLIGDYLFVTKYAYGYSRYSFPFSPDLFDGRIWGELPERGDVVVFKHPQHDACSAGLIGSTVGFVTSVFGVRGYDEGDCIDYVKRVVGLPGDSIQVTTGVLSVNGEPVGMERLGDHVEEKVLRGNPPRPPQCANGAVSLGEPCAKELWRETLPGGREHLVLNISGEIGDPVRNGRSGPDNTPVFTVPEGHVFVMGDNRDNSVDSRFPSVGAVPVENLIGRADLVAVSSDGPFWALWDWRWGRLFSWIE